jgi:hypothetical protein
MYTYMYIVAYDPRRIVFEVLPTEYTVEDTDVRANHVIDPTK